MIRTLRRFVGWLGPVRAQAVFVLLAVTGLLSLILNAAASVKDAPVWIASAQSVLLFVFLLGALLIILTRLPRHNRRRLLVITVPALLAFALALAFPKFWLLFLPAAIGWLVIAYIASGSRVRQEYQTAIKHLRKDDFDQAIAVMSDLIKAEPEIADHRRFRAELYRLAGKGSKARADYEKVAVLEPESSVGFNGLSELYLQEGQYERALDYAQQADALEPDQWVTLYNLGMIEDRLAYSADSIAHLDAALKVGIPDSRHRLLAHLWLARASVRTANSARAESELLALRREQTGLNEWKTVFESQQAAVLRAVLEADVILAEGLISGTESLDTLANETIQANER